MKSLLKYVSPADAKWAAGLKKTLFRVEPYIAEKHLLLAKIKELENKNSEWEDEIEELRSDHQRVELSGHVNLIRQRERELIQQNLSLQNTIDSLRQSVRTEDDDNQKVCSFNLTFLTLDSGYEKREK